VDEAGFQRFRKLYTDWFREATIEEHKQKKDTWPWYGRLQHWLFCSWRCQACKAIKAEHRKPAPKAGEEGA